MECYSFIMDFRGGTCISQVYANDLNAAITNWAKALEADKIKYLSIKTKNQLINDIPELIKDELITPIESVKNIWLFCYRFKTGFARIHIFKTDTSPTNAQII